MTQAGGVTGKRMVRMRGFTVSAVPGLIAIVVGAGRLAAPWWSKSLPASDSPRVIVPGPIFASFRAYASLPDSWPRPRTLALILFTAAFGVMCAVLSVTAFHPDPDGTYTIAGIHGLTASEPMPWWTWLVAGFFATVCIGAAGLSAWSLVRGTAVRDTPRDEDRIRRTGPRRVRDAALCRALACESPAVPAPASASAPPGQALL
jgi:hypothetical protein